MTIIGGYKYYSREEHLEYCKEHGIPPIEKRLEIYRNKRTESGRPLFDEYYDPNF